MKIAYAFAYFGDGGAEAHALILAKKAKENGDNPIFVISKSSNTAESKLQKLGIDYVYLAMESSFRPLKVIKSALGLKKIIKQQKIDIVHAHMLREHSLAIMAKVIGAKFILVRTFHRFDQFNFKMKPLMFLYKKYTDAFISISDLMTEYLAKNGITEKTHLIYNGVEKIKAETHERAIGFIGRLSPEKGVFNFIEANKKLLKNKKMVIAGSGPEYIRIKNLVEKKRLNVELMGNVIDKVEFYKKISALVLPSETEVLPMVVLEAYSCGLPVVAFDIDSLKFLVEPLNGKLIKFLDYSKMGEVAFEIIDSYKDYQNTNVTLFEEKYSSGIMWQETAILYRNLYNQTSNMIK